ncbi:hypothetical protein PMAYCL1PPCAC_00026, partial [Pristionchus mayeri]
IQMHVGTSLLVVASISLISSISAFPTSESSRVAENTADKSVGRLAFTLADPNAGKAPDAPPGGTFMDILSALTKSTFFQKFIQYIGGVAAPQKDEPKKIFATRQYVPQADMPEAARNFEASLSHDDAIESVPSGAIIAPMSAGGHQKSIHDEGFTQLLFGEKGVLTNVFQVMDAKRQNDQATMAEAARRATQADPGNAKIKDMDFGKVFDALLMGSQKKNEFGEPGPELPEFLGICNRLSCGDIYKAIDEFRRSDFFSNFQTALQLMQDPKGWEILGKMLSNPELIAQFTGLSGGGGEAAAIGGGVGGGVGAGLSGMLGSALGGAKAAVNKENGVTLTSKDGDFGTDFSSMAKIDKDPFKLPETSFSIDEGAKGEGAGGDYYSEIVSNIDEDFEVEDRDILGLPTKKPTTTTTSTTRTSTTMTTTTQRPTTTTAFSTTSKRPATTASTTAMRHSSTTSTSSTTTATSSRSTSASSSTASSRATSAAPMILPKKGDEIPLPDFEFNIDEEDYGTTFEKSIDAMPPVIEKIVVIDEKIPISKTTLKSTLMPVDMLIIGGNFMETSKIMPTSSKMTTPTTTVPSTTTKATTPRPIVPVVVPRAIVPVPVLVPVMTVPPVLVISPSSARPMRRITISGPSTQAPKNFRKESDYYAMYYD